MKLSNYFSQSDKLLKINLFHRTAKCTCCDDENNCNAMGFPENATTETLNGFSTEKLKPYVPPEQVNEPARKDDNVKDSEEPREVTIATTKTSKATQKPVKNEKKQKSKNAHSGNSSNDKIATTENSNEAQKPVIKKKTQKQKIADPVKVNVGTTTTKNSKATQKSVKKGKTQKPKIADQTASNQKSSARNKHASFLVLMAATVFALLPVIAVR